MNTAKQRVVYLVTLFAIIAMAFALLSCASYQLTPEQTAVWGGKVYIQQWDSYVRYVVAKDYTEEEIKGFIDNPETLVGVRVRDDLTEDEKDMLRARKEFLVQLHPIMKLVKSYLSTGKLPPAETQKEMVRLLNLLLGEDLQ